MMLSGLLNLLSYTIRTACPWAALPTVGWVPPHQSLIEKRHPRHEHRLLWRKQFLMEGLSSQMTRTVTRTHTIDHAFLQA